MFGDDDYGAYEVLEEEDENEEEKDEESIGCRKLSSAGGVVVDGTHCCSSPRCTDEGGLDCTSIAAVGGIKEHEDGGGLVLENESSLSQGSVMHHSFIRSQIHHHYHPTKTTPTSLPESSAHLPHLPNSLPFLLLEPQRSIIDPIPRQTTIHIPHPPYLKITLRDTL